jgi:hypothetical protein
LRGDKRSEYTDSHRPLSYCRVRYVDLSTSLRLLFTVPHRSHYCRAIMVSRRRAKRNTQAKPNKQQLIDMPLDVLIEVRALRELITLLCNNDCPSGQIFCFLEPLDLLLLSRTTKALRAFLLSRRKSSAVWKNAISNVKDFPPCPDHMSAPAYTHLAFVPVCHVSRSPTTMRPASILG